MKHISQTLRSGLFFTLSMFILSSTNSNAHESADTVSNAALIRHMFSSPDHVLMLLIAIGAGLWGLHYKLTRQKKNRAASVRHAKRDSR